MKSLLFHIVFFMFMPSLLYSEIITFNCEYAITIEYDVETEQYYKIFRKPNEDNFSYNTKNNQIISTSWHFQQISSENTKCTMDTKKLYCRLNSTYKSSNHFIDLEVNLITHDAQAHNTMSSFIHIHLNDGKCYKSN